MQFLFVSLILLAYNHSSNFVQGDAKPSKVKILVAFGAADQDSRQFILSQLSPVYNALFDVIDLELVPFGGAKFNLRERTVECENGEAECKAHSYELCAIAKFPDPQEYLPFISLVALLPDAIMSTDQAYDKCASLSGLDANVITKCKNDDESHFDMLHKAARSTPVYATQFPWVEVDDEFVDVIAGESIWDALCDALLGDDDPTNDLPFCLDNDEPIGKPRKYKGIKAADLFGKTKENSISDSAPLII